LPKPPIVMAYVTLDGADTALINLVHGEDLTDIDAAARRLNSLPRVAVKFIDDPKGRITDFSFELLSQGAAPQTRARNRQGGEVSAMAATGSSFSGKARSSASARPATCGGTDQSILQMILAASMTAIRDAG
jgi:hypothetical protein